MKNKKIDFIINETKNRLSYYDIYLSGEQINNLKINMEQFDESDYQNVTENLTNMIYEKLKEFGISDILAYRCSWKWSD